MHWIHDFILNNTDANQWVNCGLHSLQVLGFGYLVGRDPKLRHHTDGLWCVNNLPKVVT